MADAFKLRYLTSTKSLTAEELELINHDLWLIEQALISVGAISPIIPNPPPPGGVTDHGALTGLLDDDHSNHPFSPGRLPGQILIGVIGSTTSPAWPNQKEALTLMANAAGFSSWETFYEYVSGGLIWGIGFGSVGPSANPIIGIDSNTQVAIGLWSPPYSSIGGDQLHVRGGLRLSGSTGLGSLTHLARLISTNITGGVDAAKVLLIESQRTNQPTANYPILFGPAGFTGRLGIFITGQNLGSETCRIATGKDLVIDGMDTVSNNHISKQGDILTINFEETIIKGDLIACDLTDPTKQVTLDITDVATATKRTWGVQNHNGKVPVIVANDERLGQTGDIGSGGSPITLYTPSAPGMYRLDYFLNTSVDLAASGDFVALQFMFTSNGIARDKAVNAISMNDPPLSYEAYVGGSYTIHSDATPIQFYMVGAYSGAEYDIHLSLTAINQ